MTRFWLAGSEVDRRLVFNCPGCGELHAPRIGGTGPGPLWAWCGDLDHPTLSPSIRVRGKFLCHSFLRDGRLQFLGDCEHALAGQTVDVPEDDS